MIHKFYNEGNIIIHPFNKDRLKNNSYDVSLGEHFYIETPTEERILNMWTKEGVEKVWKPGTLMNKEDIKEKYPNSGFGNLPNDAKIILLQPGECILAHTQEFIGGVSQITTQMFCRSSYGPVITLKCKIILHFNLNEFQTTSIF